MKQKINIRRHVRSRPKKKREQRNKAVRARKRSGRRTGLGRKLLHYLIAAICGILLVLLIMATVPGENVNGFQVRENSENIEELQDDVDDIGEDLDQLSEKFDDFMYQQLELMLDMKQTINDAAGDSSVHVTLSSVGVADAGASSSSEVDQSQDKNMPHS